MRANSHERERERLEALRALGVLDTAPEALFDELVALATDLFDVPVALVSLVDEHRQWFKARAGFEPRETGREISFCAHAILGDEVFVVEDALDDPRFADNPLVVGDPSTRSGGAVGPDDAGGSDRRIRFYAGAPLLTDEGLPLGTLCVIDHRPRRFDERDRRRLGLLRDQAMALLDRRRLQVESERHVRLKSDFLTRTSHEVRTPLAAMLGHAELLGDTLERADDLDAVRAILRNGRFLQSIIDDLLDLSRIEAGRLDLNPVPCALDELLSDIDALAAVQARDKGIGWRIDCPDALPLRVLVDALRLRQILTNLVGNALKFVERGEVVLSLALHDDSAAVTALEFAVRDTGIGMSAEQMERVFAPFGQAESDTAARFGGSGLGLTISRELTGLLGGELLVESRPGAGSVFRLRLPCEPVGCERRVPGIAAARPDVTRPVAVRVGDGPRVLIVDDSDDLARALVRSLTGQGYRAAAAGTAGAALALAERVPPDCIVLDRELPDMDSSELLARLRALAPLARTRFVSLTGSETAPEERRRLGFDLYLRKPVPLRSLIDALGRLLDVDAPV